MKRGLDCIEPMGIKFPEQSFVLRNNLKTFTPIGSGQFYPFFPPSTGVARQINSASSNTNSLTVKSEAVCSPEHQNIQPLCTWCKTQRKIIN
jgi:hypothetical protein